MNTIFLTLLIRFQDLANREEGQNLVEYALLVALVAFGSAVSMKALSTALGSAFKGISTTLGTYIS